MLQHAAVVVSSFLLLLVPSTRPSAGDDLGSKLRNEVGRDVTYRGRIQVNISGANRIESTSSFQLEYVTLSKETDGRSELLVLERVEPGSESRDGEARETARHDGSSALRLGADLRRVSDGGMMAFSMGNMALGFLSGVPFPPAGIAARPGATAEIGDAEIPSGASWPAPMTWKVEDMKDGLRVVGAPKTLPVAPKGGEGSRLLALTQTYCVDPARGDVSYIEHSWTSAYGEGADETRIQGKITLTLTKTAQLDAAAVAKLVAARKVLCDGQSKVFDETDGEKAGKLAEELEKKLEGTPFAAEAKAMRAMLAEAVSGRAAQEAHEAEARKWVGKPAPAFEGKDLDGNAVSLAALKGKVVVLSFWASWCGPCNEEMPHLDKIAEKYAPRGLVVLGMNSQPDSAAAKEEKHFRSKKLHYAAVLGARALASQLMINAIPATFVIDRDGVIREREIGFEEEGIGALEKKIEALLLPAGGK